MIERRHKIHRIPITEQDVALFSGDLAKKVEDNNVRAQSKIGSVSEAGNPDSDIQIEYDLTPSIFTPSMFTPKERAYRRDYIEQVLLKEGVLEEALRKAGVRVSDVDYIKIETFFFGIVFKYEPYRLEVFSKKLGIFHKPKKLKTMALLLGEFSPEKGEGYRFSRDFEIARRMDDLDIVPKQYACHEYLKIEEWIEEGIGEKLGVEVSTKKLAGLFPQAASRFWKVSKDRGLASEKEKGLTYRYSATNVLFTKRPYARVVLTDFSYSGIGFRLGEHVFGLLKETDFLGFIDSILGEKEFRKYPYAVLEGIKRGMVQEGMEEVEFLRELQNVKLQSKYAKVIEEYLSGFGEIDREGTVPG